LQSKQKLKGGLIVVAMRPRRSPRVQQRRHRHGYAGVRKFVEWLTVAFVIFLLLSTVVMLVFYEWHAVHPTFK
jgi:hypothetical protein